MIYWIPCRQIRTLFLTLTLSSVFVGYGHATYQPCEKEISQAAKRFSIPIAILYAVGLTETGARGRLHPYALNVQGKSYFPGSLKEAISIFKAARKNGKLLIDLGCMQINYKYHRAHFKSFQAMFNPHQNVHYAARFLRRLKNRHGSWVMAVARYHAGEKNNDAQQKYVCRVLKNMIAQKLAKSTDSTKKVCKSVG